MTVDEKRYWPFPVLPAEEQTELHKKEIALLEEFYADGRRPYVFGSENFGMGDERGRWIEFIYRRRQHSEPRWEPSLLDGERRYPNGPLFKCTESAAVFVVGFERLRQVALRWLAGIAPEGVYEDISVVIPERDRRKPTRTNKP